MEEIAPNVYVEFKYPDLNLGAIVTHDGIVCIDTPPCPADSQDWIMQLKERFGLPIQYLILTDYHADRTVMASTLHARTVAHRTTQKKLASYGNRFPAPMLDSLAMRYDLLRKEFNGTPVVHPQISFCDEATLVVGNTMFSLMHMPSATPGSLWVLLKDEQVLFTGDSVVIDRHPPLVEAESKAWLDALVELRRKRFQAELIVPGRGPICDKSATEPISEYLRLARRRVQALYRSGRPRADTTTLIPDFLTLLPHDHLPKEWINKQIKMGLDHIYDEFKAADTSRSKN